ncbi:MAG: XRE family transcriptional regulator [Eubacteriales bacterium]|nr:XRE family transcriptional regulator [Eubacteriales bacterium]
MLIYDRIRMLCKEKGVTVTGTEMELGFARGSLCKIDKNKPSMERLQKLADYFKVEADWLVGASEYRTKREMLQHFDDITDIPALRSEIFRLERGSQIPVLGEVAAGQPIFAEEKYIGYEDISEKMAKSGTFFGLKIKGDSMSPRISEGDTVIVRQQEDAESGDVVIVLINGETATCKRLMKYAEGITLLSFNPTYEPMTFSNKEILEKPVKIIGKVVENRQKY